MSVVEKLKQDREQRRTGLLLVYGELVNQVASGVDVGRDRESYQELRETVEALGIGADELEEDVAQVKKADALVGMYLDGCELDEQLAAARSEIEQAKQKVEQAREALHKAHNAHQDLQNRQSRSAGAIRELADMVEARPELFAHLDLANRRLCRLGVVDLDHKAAGKNEDAA